ncbi:arylesterase [Marinicella gelatinilytica]|uniref:arylesterase n=1 Tax=Marinicella gelatinilytica TaxID=2996017 RepID=UPI002260A984|nr:arylesterase [Marinicella gelatinilytica]MCX7544319.1 arylesterase [Marinicella gelatinilytica]
MNNLKYGLWVIMLFGLMACQDTAPPNNVNNTATEAAQNDFVILALGDSLTEGLGVDETHNYPAILQQQLHNTGFVDVKVVNAGLSGETSTGLLNRLDWVMQLQPDLTILTIGANDAMRGLDLERTDDNIRTIIKILQQKNSDVILAGMEIYDNLGREYVSGFKDIYPRIAKDLDLPFIPFFLQGVAGDPELNQQDGIHPNHSGYQVIVENNILPAVTQYLNNNKP